MDSFAGSEPLKFISFRLGNESNGQPAQTDKSPNGSGDDDLDQRSSVVQETVSSTVANRTDEMSPLTSTMCLPTGIEIIEGSGTQSSTEQKVVRKRCCVHWITRSRSYFEATFPRLFSVLHQSSRIW